MPGFRVDQKETVLRACDYYLETSIDFSDAIIAATMEAEHARILYTYDRHFDSVPGIQRVEPGQFELGTNGANP
jgi:predicted nucleic acid-binding protein